MVFKNKQSQNKPRATKKVIILGVAFLLVVFAGLFYFLSKQDKVAQNTEPQDENAYRLDSREELENPQNAPSEIKIGQNETPERNPDYTPPEDGQITITRVENTGNEVVVAALVQGIEVGSCDATYSQGSSRVTASAPIQQGPTYFACQVSVPRSQFNTQGTWHLVLKAGSASGESEISL